MREKAPGTKFIVFIVFSVIVSGLLVLEIGNIDPLAERTTYQAEFDDVTGLIANDAVKIAGVTVGKVTSIEIRDGRHALVTFQVDNDVELTDDTLLAIRWRDLFGLRFLYLDPGSGATVEAMHEFPRDQTAAPVDLARLLDRLTPVIAALDPDLQNQVLRGLSEALAGRETQVQEIIADGAELTSAIASRDAEIGRLLVNAGNILDAYANREAELRALVRSFADVSTTLAERNQVLDQAVVGIARGMDELGEFVEANDDEVRLALDELEELTDVLSTRRDLLERSLEGGGRGLVAYHLVSRLGQWFNVNAVGVSVNYDEVTADRGAELPVLRDPATGTAARGTSGAPAGAALVDPAIDAVTPTRTPDNVGASLATLFELPTDGGSR